MKTQVLTDSGLAIYDEEIKDYIAEHAAGVTQQDLNNTINDLESYVITNNDIETIIDGIFT